jgi:hypothetical protein
MPKQIRITAGEVSVDAELNDTGTANAIADALPISASASTWGDEIYFRIPVDTELENGQEVVELGDLGYWPPGQAFCLFFGLTPASRGDEIRPASAVTVIGKILGDTERLKQVPSGASVAIESASP